MAACDLRVNFIVSTQILVNLGTSKGEVGNSFNVPVTYPEIDGLYMESLYSRQLGSSQQHEFGLLTDGG